jgi:hypothetical protein
MILELNREPQFREQYNSDLKILTITKFQTLLRTIIVESASLRLLVFLHSMALGNLFKVTSLARGNAVPKMNNFIVHKAEFFSILVRKLLTVFISSTYVDDAF